MSTIEVSNVVAGYGRQRVLEGLTFDVPAGSVTALLGNNGAGKSTLVRVLTGRLKPSSGQVRVLGLDPQRQRMQLLRSIGLVPEGGGWSRWMRLRDIFALQRPLFPSWDLKHEAELLERFGLNPKKRFSELSKGGRACVALVGALAHKPRALVLDEPFSGLDVGTRRKVFDALLEHLAQEEACALVISHSLADVERCADRVVRLSSGRTVMQGDLESVLEDARRLRVQLDPDTIDWTPPGTPQVEATGEAHVF
ncbi:MAG: ABC-2 type transport system ATP-binding protein, partial [Planctomycetota bacterium]